MHALCAQADSSVADLLQEICSGAISRRAGALPRRGRCLRPLLGCLEESILDGSAPCLVAAEGARRAHAGVSFVVVREVKQQADVLPVDHRLEAPEGIAEGDQLVELPAEPKRLGEGTGSRLGAPFLS
jgi:hypothetical protein